MINELGTLWFMLLKKYDLIQSNPIVEGTFKYYKQEVEQKIPKNKEK